MLAGEVRKIYVYRALYDDSMTIVLSHISALEYFRRNPNKEYTEVPHARGLITSPPKYDCGMMNGLGELNRPLHVLVASAALRRNSQSIVSHVWNRPLQKGFILAVQNELAVVSPELCFIQMAGELPVIELIKLGYELCGSYRIHKDVSFNCKPLTSVERLKTFAETIHHIRGHRNAHIAIHHIRAHSASPMETNLMLLLCLPYRFGGYGIELPSLNYRIEVNPYEYYLCDLYWPRIKVAIEYDSDMFHVGADRITSDSIRRSRLNALGILVISVTRRQVMNREEFHKIAELIAKLTSKELQYKKPAFWQAHNDLRKTLFKR